MIRILRLRGARRRIDLAAVGLVTAALALSQAASATAGLPTGTYSLGHYELHVNLSYQAHASSAAPTNNPAPAPETGLRPYWNFTSQSEGATLAASWATRLELFKKGLGARLIRPQPVHFPQALGEIHDFEVRALGSPGVSLAVNGSYSGTFYQPINETCYAGQACPNHFTAIPFTCTLSEQNGAIDGDLRTEWVEVSNSRLEDHGYLNPLNPGAVSLGVAFALMPAHENSAKGGGEGSSGATPGFVSPTCPANVNVFEPWLAEGAMLSEPHEPGSESPGSRLALFPLSTLIRRGHATASFSGPATSPSKCCSGTTTYMLSVTAHRVH